MVLIAVLIAAGMRNFYALISFGFCLFVALTVIVEFFKGGRSIGANRLGHQRDSARVCFGSSGGAI